MILEKKNELRWESSFLILEFVIHKVLGHAIEPTNIQKCSNYLFSHGFYVETLVRYTSDICVCAFAETAHSLVTSYFEFSCITCRCVPAQIHD